MMATEDWLRQQRDDDGRRRKLPAHRPVVCCDWLLLLCSSELRGNHAGAEGNRGRGGGWKLQQPWRRATANFFRAQTCRLLRLFRLLLLAMARGRNLYGAGKLVKSVGAMAAVVVHRISCCSG